MKVIPEEMIKSYWETALWSSTGDNDLPLDGAFDYDDISPESILKSSAELISVVNRSGELLERLDLTVVAHDLWLTRNGHGAGFWDGDYKELDGKILTAISKGMGTVDLYESDDGFIRSSNE